MINPCELLSHYDNMLMCINNYINIRGVVYNLSWNDGSGWLDGSGFSLLGGSEFCVSEYATLINYLSSYDQCLNLLSNSLIFCL